MKILLSSNVSKVNEKSLIIELKIKKRGNKIRISAKIKEYNLNSQPKFKSFKKTNEKNNIKIWFIDESKPNFFDFISLINSTLWIEVNDNKVPIIIAT